MRSIYQRLEPYIAPGEYRRKQLAEAKAAEDARKDLADKMDAFLDTDVGQYLMTNIERDKKVALKQLTEIPPHEVEKMMEAQNKYQVAQKIYSYIQNCLKAGNRSS